jgi:hypothetical protein
LREQQEIVRRLAEGPLRYIHENQPAIARMQALARSLDNSAVLRVAEAFNAVNLAHASAIAELTSGAFKSFVLPDSVIEMQRYAEVDSIYKALEEAAIPYRRISEQVESMSRYLDATRFITHTTKHDRIGELISAAERERDVVARVSERLLLRHAELIASLSLPEGRLLSVPPFASELPTIDIFIHSEALRVITPHEPLAPEQERQTASLRLEVESETLAFLEIALPELNPPFLSQYRGAKACAAGRAPDWWTHGSASLRKLLKGVLHTAATNEEVLPWAKQNHKELDRNDRPTRATKVEWLCSFISNDAYRAYVRTELNSALALIDLLDTAQHTDEFPEFEQQYDWTFMRAEFAIRHILTIWKARRSQ